MLVLQDAQLDRPVGERQAQALDVGMAVEQFRFDGRDLAPALLDSRCLLLALSRDIVELAFVAVERCFPTGVVLRCERRARKARLMEIDPKYADCIVQRWQG